MLTATLLTNSRDEISAPIQGCFQQVNKDPDLCAEYSKYLGDIYVFCVLEMGVCLEIQRGI